jgi:hypothetical protein
MNDDGIIAATEELAASAAAAGRAAETTPRSFAARFAALRRADFFRFFATRLLCHGSQWLQYAQLTVVHDSCNRCAAARSFALPAVPTPLVLQVAFRHQALLKLQCCLSEILPNLLSNQPLLARVECCFTSHSLHESRVSSCAQCAARRRLPVVAHCHRLRLRLRLRIALCRRLCRSHRRQSASPP